MSRPCRPLLAFLLVTPLALTGCPPDGTSGSSSSSSSGGGGPADAGSTPDAGGAPDAGGPTPACTSPTTITCEDELIQLLNLKRTVNPDAIQNTAQGEVWMTVVDATAGGAFAENPPSYVYASFTDQGLVKRSLSDEDALASMDWDIAFRRYVIRVNSGNSGPSCVQAMRLPATASFETVTAPPEGGTYRSDTLMTASCELIPDGSGMPSSPATALSSYYTYPGCVQMTYNVYVVRLASGHHVKLSVLGYYNDTAQRECQDTDHTTTTPTGSGTIKVAWAFL
jgi:hypothetical protein